MLTHIQAIPSRPEKRDIQGILSALTAVNLVLAYEEAPCSSTPSFFIVPTALATLCSVLLHAQAPAATSQGGQEEAEILRDLLEVLNTPVVSASKSREYLREAPATLIVITRADLQARGYTTFFQILDDLPGFDQMTLYGDTFVKPYARGIPERHRRFHPADGRRGGVQSPLVQHHR